MEENTAWDRNKPYLENDFWLKEKKEKLFDNIKKPVEGDEQYDQYKTNDYKQEGLTWQQHEQSLKLDISDYEELLENEHSMSDQYKEYCKNNLEMYRKELKEHLANKPKELKDKPE